MSFILVEMSVATVQSTAEGDGTVIVIVVVAVFIAGSDAAIPMIDVAYCWNTCIVHVPTCASVVGRILAV